MSVSNMPISGNERTYEYIVDFLKTRVATFRLGMGREKNKAFGRNTS